MGIGFSKSENAVRSPLSDLAKRKHVFPLSFSLIHGVKKMGFFPSYCYHWETKRATVLQKYDKLNRAFVL